MIQTVCAHLRPLKVLFLVDNCEHLIQACADLAAAILKTAPNVRMVTSSREALRVPGEQAYPILPLPVPSRDDSIETMAGMTAVRLFVERAQQHKPAFELNAFAKRRRWPNWWRGWRAFRWRWNWPPRVCAS